MSNEKSIIVKLPPSVKAALEKQAQTNGRAMMREAAKLIEHGVKKKGRAQ